MKISLENLLLQANLASQKFNFLLPLQVLNQTMSNLQEQEGKLRIGVTCGDINGIGMEVMPEGQRVLEAAGRKFGFTLAWDEKPWSCE